MTESYPCGRCDTGTYAYAAIFNPCSQAIAAGGPLPRCKSHDRVCVGAQDFKAAFDTSTPEQQAAIMTGKAVEF